MTEFVDVTPGLNAAQGLAIEGVRSFPYIPLGTVVQVTDSAAQTLTANGWIKLNNFVAQKSRATAVAPVGADPTGTVDSYGALQAWASLGATMGIPLHLPAGTYATSKTIDFSGLSLILDGDGATRSIIKSLTAGLDGVRFNIGNSVATPCGHASDFGVVGPAANPTDFSTGILFDACKGFEIERTDVANFDIGYRGINNCFNSSMYSPSCHRFNSCNVGIYLQGFDGVFEAGNDISVYDPILSNKLSGIIVGPGGGYHFFGGQIGTSGLSANRDDLAAIMLGIQYDAVVQSGIGTTTTGACTADFTGLSIEGVNRMWFIQSYDENTCGFYNIGFTPSVTGANAALGLVKLQNWKNGLFDFGGCLSIQAGGILQTAICSIAGGGSGCLMREGPWQQGSLTVNSVAVPTRTMVSLAMSSNAPQCGVGCARRSNLAVSIIGHMGLRPSTQSGAAVLQFSTDALATWASV